jgi:hypothetical protein
VEPPRSNCMEPNVRDEPSTCPFPLPLPPLQSITGETFSLLGINRSLTRAETEDKRRGTLIESLKHFAVELIGFPSRQRIPQIKGHQLPHRSG